MGKKNGTENGQGKHSAPIQVARLYSDVALTNTSNKAVQQEAHREEQDISLRQMMILLEVAGKTDSDLGHMLATGEQESAKTWDPNIRPYLKDGGLGSAMGVWQFQPATFDSLINKYGDRLLTLSQGMDLGDDTFNDAQVRHIISVHAGRPEKNHFPAKPGSQELMSLRSNFAVAAFAKHLLEEDSGATTPEGKYIYHFLGSTKIEQCAANPALKDNLAVDLYGADSGSVRGNPGMFYRGGDVTKPFTNSEFMQHLKGFISASDDNKLVRQKYGVGFMDMGGDTPGHSPRQMGVAQLQKDMWTFASGDGQDVRLPAVTIYASLNKEETAGYLDKLKSLVASGKDKPTADLSEDETKWLIKSLQKQGVLARDTAATKLSDPQVQQAMDSFRDKIGMAPPDDPANNGKLMPQMRAALDFYNGRVDSYAALQESQKKAMKDGLDLNALAHDAEGREAAEIRIIAIKDKLADAGLLKHSSEKVVKTNRKGRKYSETITKPFDGSVDGKMIKALSEFQAKNGLLNTNGVADAETMKLLGVSEEGIHFSEYMKHMRAAPHGVTVPAYSTGPSGNFNQSVSPPMGETPIVTDALQKSLGNQVDTGPVSPRLPPANPKKSMTSTLD